MAAGTVFIGRAAELGRLDAALDRAGHGQPQVLLLAGDQPRTRW
jgi:predicted ATPase